MLYAFQVEDIDAMSRPEKRARSSLPLVIIASPSPEVRSRWRRGIPESFSAHEVGRQVDLERAMAGLGPDILLFDLNLSRPDGIEALPSLLKLSPATRVILLTGHPNDREGIAALKAGVRGYCHREIAPSLVKKVLDVVLKGEVWVGRMLVPRLMEELALLTEREQAASHGDPDGRLEGLTHRAREIARLIGRGASNKEIAKQLSISDRTVKAHITMIFHKLGFSDRLRLALFVVNEGSRGVWT